MSAPGHTSVSRTPSSRGDHRRAAKHILTLVAAAALLGLAPSRAAMPNGAGSRSVDAGPDTVAGQTAFPVREIGYDLDFRVDFEEEKLYADIDLTVQNRTDGPVHEVPLVLYRLMTVRTVEDARGDALPFRQVVTASERNPKKQVNYVRVTLPRQLSIGERMKLRIVYDGYLEGYAKTGSSYVRDRIDEAFTILREDALAYPEVGRPGAPWPGLPTFDYRARVTVPATHVVANGGELLHTKVDGEKVTYVYRNTEPAWRMDFAVARYGMLGDGAFRVYYLPGDSVGGARVLAAVRNSLDLFTRWFGPLREPPRMAVLEIPDGYGSQKDVTSILQTAAAFRDPDRLYEVYHEVSHFWNVPPANASSPRLEEGLASYLEDLAAEELRGEERLEPTVRRLVAWVRSTFAENPRYAEVPMSEYGREEMTGLSYVVGQLMFYTLGEIVGQEDLRQIVGTYYRRYAATGAGVAELAAVADEVTDEDLEAFFEHWLFTTRWYDYLAEAGTIDEYTAAYRSAVSRERP